VVICLQRGADCLHMVQLMLLHPKTASSLASFKSRLVSPFWCRPTQAVLEKRPLNGCIMLSVSKSTVFVEEESVDYRIRNQLINLTVPFRD